MNKKRKRLTTKIGNFICAELENLTREELKQVISDCVSLNERNCWWLEHHLKNIVKETAEDFLRLLDEKEKMAKEEQANIQTTQ